MSQAERIIAKFGTQDALADALGVHQSAISAWKKRGFIPARQQQKVLDAAGKKGISLSADDFFDLPDSSHRAAS